MSVKRMRTINESFDLIKKVDSDTAVTTNFIRKLCKENKIQYFLSGKKVILNFDELENYLNHERGRSSTTGLD